MATLFSPDFIAKWGKRKFIWEEFYERSFKGPVVSAHNAFDDACKFFDSMMKPDRRDQFDTWILDSGTTLSEDAQNKAIILLGSPAYKKMSSTHEQALQYGLVLPKIQDYGAERSLVEQFTDMVLSADKNFVMICHEKEQRDKDGSLIGIEPLLTGKSSEAIPLRFDEVYNIQARKGETHYNKETHMVTQEWIRACQTSPDGLRKVGSRNGVKDGTLWDYDSVVAQIRAAQSVVDKAAAPAA